MEHVTSPVPSSVTAKNEGGQHPGSEVPMLFIGVSLTLGIVCRQLLHGSRVPYTVALLVLGMGLGSLGELRWPSTASLVWLPLKLCILAKEHCW